MTDGADERDSGACWSSPQAAGKVAVPAVRCVS